MADQKETVLTNVVCKVLDSGPVQITGDVEMLDGAGTPYKQRRMISLCRCGQSKRKPYCDSTHVQTGFEDECRAASFTGSKA